MKGTIIGSDLLEFNNSVKILEINTNTTIFNSAADLLDYTLFFEMLVFLFSSASLASQSSESKKITNSPAALENAKFLQAFPQSF